MDQNQNIETPISHYNDDRKRSFFFSRLFVIISMVVLLVALGINMSFLYSQQKTSTTSQAANPNSAANLPALPKGCEYQTLNNKIIVACPTTRPSQAVKQNNGENKISVELPVLPSQCRYLASKQGYEVKCATAQPPIPTVQIILPTICPPSEASSSANANCRTSDNPSVINQLPNLPKGCEYRTIATNTYIVCITQVN